MAKKRGILRWFRNQKCSNGCLFHDFSNTGSVRDKEKKKE